GRARRRLISSTLCLVSARSLVASSTTVRGVAGQRVPVFKNSGGNAPSADRGALGDGQRMSAHEYGERHAYVERAPPRRREAVASVPSEGLVAFEVLRELLARRLLRGVLRAALRSRSVRSARCADPRARLLLRV